MHITEITVLSRTIQEQNELLYLKKKKKTHPLAPEDRDPTNHSNSFCLVAPPALALLWLKVCEAVSPGCLGAGAGKASGVVLVPGQGHRFHHRPGS